MKNFTKLILANVFALVSVAILLLGTNLLGIDISWGSGAIIPTIVLFFIPQTGFIYLFWKSSQFETKKVTA